MCEALVTYFPDSIIRIIPNKLPPHRSAVVGAYDRIAMLQLALAGIEQVEIDDIELQCNDPSYTINTVKILRNRFGPKEIIVFVVGADALDTIYSWYQPEQLANFCNICVLDRNGLRASVPRVLSKMILVESVTDLVSSTHGAIVCVEAPSVPISSTQVRQELGFEGHSHLITPEVMKYIKTHKLYQDRRL